MLPVGWSCVSGQSHFWLHLHLWEMVFLVHVAVLNHTQVHPLPHTPFLGRLQEALEVEKASERWQWKIWARLVIHLYLRVGEVQSPVSDLPGCAGIGSAAQGGIFLPSILVPDNY